MKRVVATLLTGALTMGLLAGCGQNSDSGKNDSAKGGTEKSADNSGSDGEVQEITWMFWDDLNATEDLISKGYAQVQWKILSFIFNRNNTLYCLCNK